MQPKNILFIIETLDGGGAERVTSILASKFSDQNYNVSIIIINKAEKEYFLDSRVKKYYLSTIKSSHKIIRFLNNFIKIQPLVWQLKSDVVISLAMPHSNLYLFPALLLSKSKIIISERSDPKEFPQSYLLKKLRNVLFRLADCVVFQTSEALSYFSSAIQKKGKVIPNPIKDVLPERYTGKRKKEIVNFCRLDAAKNLPMLMDAFEMFVKDFPDYRLTLYGKGKLEQELKEYAKKKQVKENQITFQGYQNNIHEIIKKNAMFVSSSNYEGISNSMLEALAIGLPTICTDCPVGGARMFIRPYENGLLVPLKDTKALYEAMKEIAQSESLSDQLSRNAISIREELSAEKIFNQWRNVVEDKGQGYPVETEPSRAGSSSSLKIESISKD